MRAPPARRFVWEPLSLEGTKQHNQKFREWLAA
jgi:hypothetical protein